jgi:hypothetical protein
MGIFLAASSLAGPTPERSSSFGVSIAPAQRIISDFAVARVRSSVLIRTVANLERSSIPSSPFASCIAVARVPSKTYFVTSERVHRVRLGLVCL